MGNLDNGGYAFPIPNADFQTFAPGTVEEYKRIQSGMTLRDYFAAKAMQGWLASFSESDDHPYVSGKCDAVAEASYALADAMLKAREE
ncbi:TPA: hypothetical protein OUF56_004112 [Enterobacter bugandensis]|nr:hypothetical protein [Enterobacter bugandensis]